MTGSVSSPESRSPCWIRSPRDLHVCGYLIDPADPALRAQLAHSRGDRERRAERMIEALEQDGWVMDHDLLDARARAGQDHRPSAPGAGRGRARGNVARLEREQLDGPTAFLVAYLIEGRPAFREREAPSAAEAIELIHGAGGVAVWAHPFWDVEATPRCSPRSSASSGLGLDGVEAFYVTHTRAQTDLLVRRCAELACSPPAHPTSMGPTTASSTASAASAPSVIGPNLGPIADLRRPIG